MSAIFENNAPGSLVALPVENPRPFEISIAGQGSLVFGITTSASVEQSVAAQVQLSLDRDVFVTPFGDNPGTLQVSFILNGEECDGIGAKDGEFFARYESLKLSPEGNRSPLIFVVGSTSFIGFIMSSRVQASAETGMRMITGAINAVVWQL